MPVKLALQRLDSFRDGIRRGLGDYEDPALIFRGDAQQLSRITGSQLNEKSFLFLFLEELFAGGTGVLALRENSSKGCDALRANALRSALVLEA